MPSAAPPIDEPLRYAIVVSVARGFASRFVERAAASPAASARLVAVVLNRNDALADSPRRSMRRTLRKVRRIGMLGALNGLRMRAWYDAPMRASPDIRDVCRSLDVPLVEIASFRDEESRARVRALGLDLGVSMGNGIIPRAFFEIPRRGMINIHHEWLPEYRGAQTALWQLHDGSSETGWSVHEITERLDGGPIFLREHLPILFRSTLRQTITDTYAAALDRSVVRLGDVLERFDAYRASAIANSGGRTFTTPSASAMLRIYRNYRRLRGEAARAAISHA